MADKYEFLSPEWVKELRRILEDGLAEQNLTGIDFTLSEEYTDVPAHLTREAQRVGFYFRIRDDRVEVGHVPRDDADFRIICDYATMKPSVSMTQAEVVEATGKDLAGLLAAHVAAGKAHVFGERSAIPSVLASVRLHDNLAPRTC